MIKNNSKIKILYTIPNFDTAGSGKVLYDLAKGLDKEKFEVLIACSNNKGAFFKEVEALGLPIHFINTTVNYKPYFSLFSRIKPYKNFVKQHKIDIVHSWHWSSDWTEVLAAKWGGAKFIFTKKAMSWGNLHWKIRSFLADFIVTINNEMKNYFPYKKRQKLIPIGIDTTYYSKEPFKKESNFDGFKIVSVANFVPVKGIEILIKAVNLIDNPKIFLDLVGDDRSEYATELQNLIKELKLENQIKFLGKFNDVRPFLSNADMYVIPTLNEGRKEGMPMALVEAMCMELPVLGSNISGINFVLNDFQDLLFKANNIEELASKINLIYHKTDEERVEIGNSLRQYCINNFSEQMSIDEHEKLYKSLIKN